MCTENGIPRIYIFVRNFSKHEASGTQITTFGIQFDEAVREESVGKEVVAQDISMNKLARQVAFLVYANLQEVC